MPLPPPCPAPGHGTICAEIPPQKGGAIYNDDGGILNITYVSFTSNEAPNVRKSCLETPLVALVLTKEMPLSPPCPAHALFFSDHAPTTGPEHSKTNHRAPHATPHPHRPFQTMGNVPRNGRGTRPLAAARPPSASPPRRLCPPGTLAERPWAWWYLT